MRTKDVRNREALDSMLKDELNRAMGNIYRRAAAEGYDNVEARLAACRMMMDRTLDVAAEDHAKSPIRAINKLTRILEGKGLDWNAIAELP